MSEDDFYEDSAPDTVARRTVPAVPSDMDDQDGFYDDPSAEPKYGLKRGRYVYPDPPGYKRRKGQRGFMRMTNLAAAFSDQIRLQHWRERMLILGLRTEEGETLYDEVMAADLDAMEPDKAKEWLEAMADRIADAGGAGHGARRGTARHTMLQVVMETGVLQGTRRMRLQYESLQEALEQHDLEPIPGWSERRVCNTTVDTMGTLDLGVMCRRTGQLGILDLKTARRFWTYQEAAGQQWGYDSAQWVWEGPADDSGHWEPPPGWNLTGAPGGDFEGRRVALLAHMPQAPGPDQLPVTLVEVALDYGQEVMEQAQRNVGLRSRGASVAAGRRVGAPRPLPRKALTAQL